jgi:hypothetical protein
MLKLQMRQFGHDDFQRSHFIIAWKWKANWKTNKAVYDQFFPSERVTVVLALFQQKEVKR